MGDIPPKFARYFWDVDIDNIDLNEHQIFIIERLLCEGDHNTLRWILDTYSKEQIKNAVKESRGLDLKTARYWQLYFGLQEDEMRCFGRSLIIADIRS